MLVDYKNQLNSEQFEAVTSPAKKLRIIAGAGTGKTRVLTYRVCYLIDELKYNPSNIVCITFTNKVAKEMQDRVNKLLTDVYPGSERPIISTFHSFALRLLKIFADKVPGYKKDFSIIDDEDQYKAYFASIASSKYLHDLTKNEIKVFKAIISKLKNNGITAAEMTKDDVEQSVDKLYSYENIKEVYTLYSAYLKKVNVMDYDDLLLYAELLVETYADIKAYCQRKFKCILVDEFQDTNWIQFRFLSEICTDETMLTVVGDPDQTIYTWRGADNTIINKSIKKTFSDLVDVPLIKNYRSAPQIIQYANNLIQNNSNRIPKILEAIQEQTEEFGPECVECYTLVDSESEAIFISERIKEMVSDKKIKYSDVAIIYRANYLSRVLEKRLNEKGIPYNVYGGIKYFERAEIKDALAYMKLLVNVDDDIAFERVMKSPSRGAGDVVFTRAREISDAKKISLYTVFEKEELKKTKGTTASMEIFFKAYNKCKDRIAVNPHDGNIVVHSIKTLFEETGFMKYLRDEDEKKDSSSTSKVDNVIELLDSLSKFFEQDQDNHYLQNLEEEPSLQLFLQQTSLQSAQDDITDSEGQVSLMTVHVAKGLEFKVVFVVGLVENIFPSVHKNNSEDDMEEERRLLFVAMTRAKKYLVLTTYGGYSKVNQGNNIPSRFLEETQIKITHKRKNLDNLRLVGDYTNNRGVTSYTDESWQKKSASRNAKKVEERETPQKFGNINVSTTSDNYAIGDKIQHDKYGVGTVVALKDGGKISVQFDPETGIKTLVIGFKAFRKI